MPLLHVQAGSAGQLQDIADALWKARKVVVITGAGISTNSGIPDFRSENGLYSMIQSQFDAASKLGGPKAELSGPASDERPRKRRKTTPPIQDSIEVAPERSADSASPSERSAVVTDADENATNFESSINAASTSSDGDRSSRLEAETNNNSNEMPETMEDEVVLLSEESVLADEQMLFGDNKARDGVATGAKEEVPDPPGDVAEESSKSHEDEQYQSAKATPQATTYIISSRWTSRRNTPATQTLSSASNPPEGCQTQHPIVSQLSDPFTPKPASKSGPQTTGSSPLSSPPPAELFDAFDEQLSDPQLSSSRPSSPISTENDEEEKHDEEEDTEPSWSQDYMTRSSTFRRSLSTLKGKELFDASIWSDPLKTSVFYTFATNLRQKSRDADPTGCHQFIGHLSKTGKMVRCYTQNIDLLEDKVGLSTRLLLGAGSRSRFSTRAGRGVAASLGAAGPRDPSHNNTEPTLVPSVSCSGSPSQPAVDAAAASQGATRANSQGAPSQLLEEVNISHQRTSSGDQGLVEGSGGHSGDRGGRREQDGAKSDAQPVDTSSANPDKSLSKTDCATPTTPEHDKGVECVFLHGSLRALRCFQCGCVADWEGDRELQTMSGQQPPCPRCEDATNARQERGKRALGVGKLRPDIVLYGEDHPESQQISSIIQHDISLAPDMLIIMGTSLKVHGLKTVVREFAKTVHNRKDGKVIFVNFTKPAESVWADIIDFWVEMDCDSWVEDLKEKKPIIWMPPGSVEDEPRSTASKRRRPLTDEANKKDPKKPKKAEDIAKVANTSPANDKVKKSKQAKKVELPTATDAKPYVPKRPAAHRDCKHNAAYVTTRILGDLSRMTGRVVTPGPPPYRPALATQNTALEIGGSATETTAPANVRRGPRTKNTKSRKAHEAAVTSSLSEEKPTVKKGKSRGVPVAKTTSKHRTKSSGTATASEATSGTAYTMDTLSVKQDSEAISHVTVLAEVPVPNSGPQPAGEDIPMVSVVKNRVRKPKQFYGETGPVPSAPAQRGVLAAGNTRPKANAVNQPKKSKTGKAELTPSPDEIRTGAAGTHRIELAFLPPVLHPRPQPQMAVPQCARIQLNPLHPIDQQAIDARKDYFFQMARGQSGSPDSVSPAPEFLEPVVSPGPHDMSPKLSPNHWQKRAFSYSNALFRSPLDFTALRSGDTGVPAHMHRPFAAPQQQMVLGDAPQLSIGPSIVPSLSVPVSASSVPGDSPTRQLQRETEAAATLSQMTTYDQRQFARI